MFNIRDFRAKIDKHGLFKPSNFEVFVTQKDLMDSEFLRYRCQSAELPGRTIQTLDEKFYGFVEKIGYESIYNDITLNFICDKELREKEFFERWQDKIVGDYRTTENMKQTMFDIGYYDDYVGRVTIRIFDETGKRTKNYVMEEAYPISVGDISLSWQTGNEVAILPVTFTYAYAKKG